MFNLNICLNLFLEIFFFAKIGRVAKLDKFYQNYDF